MLDSAGIELTDASPRLLPEGGTTNEIAYST